MTSASGARDKANNHEQRKGHTTVLIGGFLGRLRLCMQGAALLKHNLIQLLGPRVTPTQDTIFLAILSSDAFIDHLKGWRLGT